MKTIMGRGLDYVKRVLALSILKLKAVYLLVWSKMLTTSCGTGKVASSNKLKSTTPPGSTFGQSLVSVRCGALGPH